MLSRCYKAFYVSLINIIILNSTVNLPGVILLSKIRDASGERKYLITASNLTELTLTLNKSSKKHGSGERKYLITASNLTELTLTLNKSSKNVLLKYSFSSFYIVL